MARKETDGVKREQRINVAAVSKKLVEEEEEDV